MKLNFLRKISFYITIVFLLTLSGGAWGQTTLTAGTATYDGTNWSGGTWSTGAPLSGDPFSLNAGTTVNINGNWTSGNIVIRENAAAASTTLSVANGVLLTAGTITINPPNGGTNNNTLNLMGSGSVTCTGLISSNSGNNGRDCKVAIATGTLTVNGNIAMGNNVNQNDITFSGAGTLTVTGNLTTGTLVGNAGTINVGGAFTPAAFTVNTSTVNFNGTGAQTIPAYNYYNLSISSARTTNNVTLINGGVIGVSNIFSPTATFTTGSYVITGNTINFNGTGSQTIPAFNYNNLTISGARTTNNVTLASSGTIGVAATFTASATFTGAGGYIRTGSTIDYNGAAQNVTGFTYNNLTLSESGTKTMLAAIIINENLAIKGTANLYTNTFQITGNDTGIFSMESGTSLTLGNTGNATNVLFPSNFVSGNISLDANSTVTYQANTGQTVSNEPNYGNLIITRNGTTKTCSGNLTVSGNISVNGTATFTMGTTAATWNILGSATIVGTLNFGTVTAKTINLTGDLIIPGAGTRTITMQGAGLAHTLNLGGENNAINTFNTTANSGSTVNYNRAGNQQIFNSGNYRNLTISNGGTKTLAGATTVNNTLTLNSGVVELGNSNLTISGAISGTFSSSSMVETNGNGFVIRNANAALPILFPIGSEGVYAPVSISAINPTTGTISGRTSKFTDLGTRYVSRYWDLTTATSNKTLTATFTYGASEITTSPTFVKYKPLVGAWQDPTGTQSFGANSFTITTNTNVVTATTSSFTAGTLGTYFSYQTGDWNNPTTWTSDPGGTTQVGSTFPENDDVVVILDGRTVSLTGNVTNTGLDITINAGGILNLATHQFTNTLLGLRGKGTLKLASTNFPTATTNTLVNAGGGTVEYNNAANFNLPVAQTTYNNLTINAAGVIGTQMNNITLNGDLYIKAGTYRINDNTSTRRQLTINGDITVDAGASIRVGTGSTNTTTNPLGINGGTAPFINYYDSHSHRVVLFGNVTNNGEIRFTNLEYPIFNAFPPLGSVATSGYATVYFRGATNNTLTCNGITDFYNLVLDKGVDQSYTLTVYSSAYKNFRLFGANISGGDTPGANPNLKKALWIRTGTLTLTGLTIIPSLSEGTCGDGANPNSDFYIPANGALILDGPEVIVLSTADDYREVNLAYDVSGGVELVNGVGRGGCSSFSIYGKVQVNNGYFSTRESGGFITWDLAAGQFVINGGIVDAKQFRAAGGAGGLSSYTQTGGLFILRGRFWRTPTGYSNISNLTDFSTATLNTARSAASIEAIKGAFNLNSTANVFNMSGGTIRVYDVMGNGAAEQKAFEVLSAAGNINVTGGTLEIVPTTGTLIADPANYYIESTARLGNLTINSASGTSVVGLRNYPLTIVSDFSITAGTFEANNLDVTIGRNFTIASGTTYTTGTNRTILNGTGTQTVSISTAAPQSFHKLIINKPATAQVRTNAGTQNIINVTDSLRILSGVFRTFTRTINCNGEVENNGTSLTTSGYLVLNSDSPQSITGNGNGIFTNLRINKPNAGTIDATLKCNITINGNLTFSGAATGYKRLNLQEYNVLMSQTANAVGADENRFAYTLGQVGNGSISKVYSTTSPSFTFPIGAPSTSRVGSPAFTPATISFSSDPTTYGTITVVPVGAEHFATSVKNRSLTYYWRVKAENFTGINPGSVSHAYTYAEADVVIGFEITEDGYVPARFDITTTSWDNGTSASINTATNLIDGPWLTGVDYIEGDFTAGDNDPISPFGAPLTYYSRNSGWWGNTANWSLSGHTIDDTPAQAPGASDIVIIGNNHTITLNSLNTTPNNDPRSCANLQIEAGATLDIGYNPASIFTVVTSHPNGNGLIRLTTNFNSGYYFTFPSGDFSDFNVNLGNTELYTINPATNTTYWLPNNINKYGNLIISPLGGSNIIFGNTDVLIYGNCTIQGQNADSWFCPTWNTNYPDPNNPALFNIARISKTITINGNMDIQGGSFGWLGGGGGGAQNVVVHGNIIVASGAAINVWQSNTSQTLSIGGSLINNANNIINAPSVCRSYVCLNAVPVIFFGNTNSTVFTANNTAYAGAEGTGYGWTDPTSPLHRSATIFGNVTVNKGTSQATTLTFTGGNISTPINGWLTLQNGTLRYMLTDPRTDFTVTTTSTLTIPGTAGLEINLASNANNTSVLIANANANNNDLFLNGKLSISNSTVYIGPAASPANNNDIEYGGGGLSEIDIRGGDLIVNGQIRMNPASTSGVLKYKQSGSSNVIIRGQAANTTNAKLEVYNPGSIFNMSGTSTLTIVRGGGGTTYGDLYIRPESSSVSGSSSIIFTQSPTLGPVVDLVQNYLLDANVPLNNLTITGKTAATARNATVTLLISPLVLNGDLTISNANSIFDANSAFSINVTVKGGFVNNGTYNYYSNLTTFSGNVQTIQGTSVTNFYNLTVNPITSLTLIRDVTVFNNLRLVSGQFLYSTFSINLKGNLENNANYDGNASVGGIILNGTSVQEISGTGTFGRLELDNTSGARINNNITLQKNIMLTSGVFNINQYLLTLGLNSNIEGSDFGPTKMIASDGVYSNVGLRKFFADYSGPSQSFFFPMGTSNKYTPANLTYTTNDKVGYIRLNNINDNHPGVIDPNNVLDYFWEVESFNIEGFNGSLVLNYLQEDVQVTGLNAETDYISAALLIPGTSWAKFSTADVDEDNNTIEFRFTNSNNLSGEYTAGVDPALPNEVPHFRNLVTDLWNVTDNWEQIAGDPYVLTGPPNGFIVTIKAGTTVTINENYASTYRTQIDGKLSVNSTTFGHNLGTVTGNGTLYLEGATFPAGRYTSFFSCANEGVLEYGGSSDYTLIADLYSTLARLYFTGTGTRSLPNKDLTICKRLLIDGPTLNNLNNRTLTIQGIFERLNTGAFTSGSGANATVRFAGTNPQTIGGVLGDFTGSNSLNNLEIANISGLTINSNGEVEVKRNLLLTSGNIITSETNKLRITNTAINCVVPIGGSVSSFVDGPLIKRILQGDNFNFPIGKDDVLGNKLTLSSTRFGTIDWEVEFFTPNPTYTDFVDPLTYINSKEFWEVRAQSNSEAIVGIKWDPVSDLTPLMTENGISDMRVAYNNAGTWTEISSTAIGNNNNGTVSTSSRITIPVSGMTAFTTAAINITKPRARFNVTGPICGDSGIPVVFTGSSLTFNYKLTYEKDGVLQPEVEITSAQIPYRLPTDAIGATYQLISFTYNNPAPITGVVDPAIVTSYTNPSPANAGLNQSVCGGTSVVLAANDPLIGSGLWSISSGTGGTVINPTINDSDFEGTNGTTYVLTWTISNGGCTSSSNVVIDFPLNPEKPDAFVLYDAIVCQGDQDVTYSVSVSGSHLFTWNYTGSDASIVGSGMAIEIDYGNNATSGQLSVYTTNDCGDSDPLLLDITVNTKPVFTVTESSSSLCDLDPFTLTTNFSSINLPYQIGIIQNSSHVAGSPFNNINLNPYEWSSNLVWIGPDPSYEYYFNVTVVDSNGCSETVNVPDITVFKIPETGPQYHIPNTHGM